MKKNLIVALALVFVLGIAGTAFAAANPFVDVPAKHWAYDAVSKLAKAGILDGYGDGTYRGERLASRYEMAQATAKAMARADKADAQMKALIDKLAVEFAAELNNLGVRVAKLEKNASSIKFWGDSRLRVQSNNAMALDVDGNTATTRWDQRVRVYAKADVNEKAAFYGRMMASWNDNNVSYATAGQQGPIYWDYGYFEWTMNPSFKVAVGRQALSNSFSFFNLNGGYDALRFTYAADRFYGNVAYGDAGGSVNGGMNPQAIGGTAKPLITLDANYKFSKDWTGNFGMYYSTNADQFTGNLPTMNATTGAFSAYTPNGGYPFQVYTFGLKGKLAQDWMLTAQYLWNSAPMPAGWNLPDSRNGWAAQLNYKGADAKVVGSWGVAFNYRSIKPWAADLGNISGIFGNSSYAISQIALGVQGFGATVDYTISKNAVLAFTYENVSTNNTFNGSLLGGTGLNSARYLPYYYLQLNVGF
jgi:hypothetical protein